MAETDDSANLDRSMGVWGLTFYGAGTILGAGIFVVIGEVIGEAGVLSPVAYMVAALVAVTTALSYSEIAARIPTAGGPIDYVEEAFGKPWLGTATGWVLTIANVVSGATITTGFVSYVGSFATLPDWVGTVGLVVLLGAIAAAGMKQTAWFMTATTLIGIATLLTILWITRDGLIAAPGAIVERFGDVGGDAVTGLFAAAFLSIYAFIGFGDMTQNAEEVTDVKRTLPRAMLTAMGIVFFFYIAIAAAVSAAGPVDDIANAQAPLVAAVEREGWPGLPFAIASLFVIVNGGLTQIVAASRLLLDLGRDGRMAPAVFGRVNARTRTPVIATVASCAVVLVLALFLPLKSLAGATSLAILVVFVAVNAALVTLKRRDQPDDVPDVWPVVPMAGVVFCGGAIVWQVVDWVG